MAKTPDIGGPLVLAFSPSHLRSWRAGSFLRSVALGLLISVKGFSYNLLHFPESCDIELM